MGSLGRWNWLNLKETSPTCVAGRTSRQPRFSPCVDCLEDRYLPATLLGLTASGALIRFDSANPVNLLSTKAITGLQDGENLLSIDCRPTTGQLFGLGSTGRLYRLNPATGVAAPVGMEPFAVALSGTSFGLDFNPVADRVRVVSSTGQNLRLHPDTGVVVDSDANAAGVQPDANLAFATGDENAGANPRVVGTAYSSSFPGATATTLYGIDANLNILVRQGSLGGSPISPNSGQLTSIGALGVNITDLAGLDIETGTGTAFAALQVTGQTVSRLFMINLGTGAATPVADIGGDDIVRGLAIVPAGSFQFSAAAFSVAETGGTAAITVNRIGGSQGNATVNFATSNGNAIAGFDYVATSGSLVFTDGQTSKTFTVPILDDVLAEGPETINLTLSGASNGTAVGVPSTAVLTIVDGEAPAISLLALTASNQLVRFDSATPGTIQSNTVITGLQTGENLLGIDFRPISGQLFGLGSSGRLYVISPTTGAASQVGTGTLDVVLNGTSFGFDFNPVPDRIRVVSDSDQNLRLNPDTGAVVDADAIAPGVQPDANLAFASGDVHTGGNPNIAGVAYTNNSAGAGTTTLYGIDSNLDILVLHGSPSGSPTSPNSGLLTTVGSLGSNTTDQVGLDIASTGNAAFASLQLSGQPISRLFLIDLATGAATQIGPIGVNEVIRDLAVIPAGAVQFSAAVFSVNESAGAVVLTVSRTGGVEGTVTVLARTSNGTATAGADYTATTIALLFNSGETIKTFAIPIQNDGRSEGNETFTVTLSNATGGATVGSIGTAVIGIVDDDQALSPNQRFVTQAYFDLLKRPPDAAGLLFFTNQLNAGTSRAEVAQQMVKSLEYRTLTVQNIYLTYLRRSADTTGLGIFVIFLGSGGTVEQVQVLVIGSPEYLQMQAGGTNNGFLASLYLDVLGRPIDPTGLSAFSQALASGATRSQVADVIFASPEYRTRLVSSYYPQFLGRLVDTTGLTAFVSLLNQGVRDEAVIAAIVGSDEYFNRQLS